MRTAIIGTGIAGMGCGHFLHDHDELTFFEQDDHIGGHTNTVTIYEAGQPVYIDTGFMVFNYATYPNLCRLFAEIGAPVKKTDMSFSVQHLPSGLEYSGSSLNHLFAQRRNMLSPAFFRMLWQIRRFNRESPRILDDPRYAGYSIGEYIKEGGYGADMLWKFLVPMSSAVWSTPMDKMLEFPATTLIRFFLNHGFLGLDTQHQWYTVDKGSQSYRSLLIAPFRHRIHTNAKVVRVVRETARPDHLLAADSSPGPIADGPASGAFVHLADGSSQHFDRIILACHGDQALDLLDNPTDHERRLLGAFHYQKNKAVLHTDTSVMPKTRLAWSSWNYRIRVQQGKLMPSTIYWMNRLQDVSKNMPYFVSINPHDDLAPNKILRTIDYEHPLFDLPAIAAQQQLQQLNSSGPVYFCGSYFNYGFHEDAFTSAINLCTRLRGFSNPEYLWRNPSTKEPWEPPLRTLIQ
jgi:predicted NAD/FAD-binding protein